MSWFRVITREIIEINITEKNHLTSIILLLFAIKIYINLSQKEILKISETIKKDFFCRDISNQLIY